MKMEWSQTWTKTLTPEEVAAFELMFPRQPFRCRVEMRDADGELVKFTPEQQQAAIGAPVTIGDKHFTLEGWADDGAMLLILTDP